MYLIIFNLPEPAGKNLFALPPTVWAALPELEAAVCPATRLEPRTECESPRNPVQQQQGYLCVLFI